METKVEIECGSGPAKQCGNVRAAGTVWESNRTDVQPCATRLATVVLRGNDAATQLLYCILESIPGL